MTAEDGELGDVARMAIATLAEDRLGAGGLGFGQQTLEGGADGAVGVNGQHRAVDHAEGAGHRQAGILVDESLTLLQGRLGVVVDDDPEDVALGPGKLQHLEVPPMHRVEVAGSDGDAHGTGAGDVRCSRLAVSGWEDVNDFLGKGLSGSEVV